MFDKHKYLVVEDTEIAVHRCNDADYAKLYPINAHDSYHYEYLWKTGSFLCLNTSEEKPIRLFGQDDLAEYRSLEVKLIGHSSW